MFRGEKGEPEQFLLSLSVTENIDFVQLGREDIEKRAEMFAAIIEDHLKEHHLELF